jgi:hypothetical protein
VTPADSSAFIGTNPYLAPGMLLACGLLALLLAALRRRLRWRGGPLALVFLLVLGTGAVVGASAMHAHRAQRFWHAHWDAARGELVLDRLPPLEDVRIPGVEVAQVLEYAAPSHTWHGRRARIEFAVETSDGRDFWSAPAYTKGEADLTRQTLQEASDEPLQRFLVGAAHRVIR